VQVDPAALELELVDLALAVLLAARLEREELSIVLQLSQQFSYRHALSVARPSHLEVRTALEVLNKAPSEFVAEVRTQVETAVS
jgi:hypothetical protein